MRTIFILPSALLLCGFFPHENKSSGQYPVSAGEYTATCSTTAEIAALPNESWCQIENTSLASVAPDPLPCGVGTQNCVPAASNASVLGAWASAALDTTQNRMLFFNGGHNDYAGNEIYAVDFDTYSVARIWGPTPNANIPTDNAIAYESYTDPTHGSVPSSRHVYYGLQYISSSNSMCLYGGSYWRLGSLISGVGSWCFDFDTDTWAQRNNLGGSLYGALAIGVDTTNDVMYMARSGYTIFSHDHALDSYSNEGETFLFSTAENIALTWYPTGGYFVGFGGARSIRITLDPVTYEPRSIPASCTTVANAVAPGAMWLPSAGQIIYYVGGGSTSTWAYDPEADACTELTADAGNLVTPVSNSAITANGMRGLWQYHSGLNVFLYAGSVNEDLYVYRTAGAP